MKKKEDGERKKIISRIVYLVADIGLVFALFIRFMSWIGYPIR